MHSKHLVSASPSLQIAADGPIVDINWHYLMKTRAEVIQANDSMPAYLLMPEITGLIDSERGLKPNGTKTYAKLLTPLNAHLPTS